MPHRQAVSAIAGIALCVSPTLAATRVIHISVDGFGWTYPQTMIDANQLPHVKRFQTEGAWTNNARTDYTYTITLPNHTSQLTGRPVDGVVVGHNWTTNVDPDPGQTLHNNKGSYVASVLDVAHDAGLRTAMYAGKSKFSIYDTSYNSANGAPHANGSDKLDVYANVGEAAAVVSNFITGANTNPAHFTFLHFADPDNSGHDSGWGSSAYNSALVDVNTALGSLFNYITSDTDFKDQTYIVLTADHGGGGGSSTNHNTASNQMNYTIPFYVWGPGITPGADLYTLNALSRANPGSSRPDYTAAGQPIRNGDAANLELDLLGLGPVPGSTINFAQNLSVPEPASLALLTIGSLTLIARRRRN